MISWSWKGSMITFCGWTASSNISSKYKNLINFWIVGISKHYDNIGFLNINAKFWASAIFRLILKLKLIWNCKEKSRLLYKENQNLVFSTIRCWRNKFHTWMSSLHKKIHQNIREKRTLVQRNFARLFSRNIILKR